MKFIILDVVIGMAFIYLLGSIFCSAVYEMFASWRNRRGEVLREGVVRLLGESPDSRSLARRLAEWLGGSKGPAAATTDVVSAAIFDHPLIVSLSKSTRRPSYIGADRFALALADVLCDAYRDGRYLYGDFANTLARMPDNALRCQLEVLHRSVQGDSKAMQQAVERWYGEMMERVTGWYKRETQVALFVTGLLVAGLLNIDSLSIGQRLWVEPQLREALAANAEAFTKSAPPQMPLELRNEIAAAEWKKLETQLPVGWTSTSRKNLTLATGLMTFAGWLITALAISFGSTFWFDALSKLISLRSAGARKGTAPASAEASQPKQPQEPSSMESKPAVGTSTPVSTSPVMPFSWAVNDLEATLKSKHVLALQQALQMPAERHSGVLDAGTRQAISDAQGRHSLPLNGEVTHELLDNLGIQLP